MLALFLSYTSLNIAHKFKLWRKIKFTIYLFTCIFFIALLLNIIMGTSWMNMWDLPIMYRNDMLRIFGMFLSYRQKLKFFPYLLRKKHTFCFQQNQEKRLAT